MEDVGAIHGQMTKILRSRRFSDSPRSRQLLQYIVESYISRKEGALKEVAIAIEVFNRTGEFDPKLDAVVRRGVGRLRERLEEYYSDEGLADVLLVEVPEGHYVPRFTRRNADTVAQSSECPLEEGHASQVTERLAESAHGPRGVFRAKVVAIVAFGLATLLGISLWRVHAISKPPIVISGNFRLGRLLMRATSEGHTPRRIRSGHENSHLFLPRNGHKLYAIGDGRVTIFNTTDLQIIKEFGLPRASSTTSMSFEGTYIYMSTLPQTPDIMLIDTKDDSLTVMSIPLGKAVFDVAGTRDGGKLFIAAGPEGLWVLDRRSNQIRNLSKAACPLSLQIDPAGRRLYVGYQCGGPGGTMGHDTQEILDVETERSVALIQDLPMVGFRAAIAPGGDLALFDALDACASPGYDHRGCPAVPVDMFYLWQTSNQRLLRAIHFPRYQRNAFFADDRHIIFNGPQIGVWDWPRQSFVELWKMGATRFGDVAIEPTGDRLFVAVAGTDDVLVFDAERSECLAFITGLTNDYSGDGTFDDVQGVGSLSSRNPPEFVAGRSGQAFRFNGRGQFLQVAVGAAYCPYCTSERTESLLVQFDATGGEMTILDRAPVDGSSIQRLYKDMEGHIVLESGGSKVSSVDVAQLSRWYELTVVTESHQTSLYLDGDLQGRISLKKLPQSAARTHMFLGSSSGKRAFLDGRIDELAVFNRVLDLNEIKSIAACETLR